MTKEAKSDLEEWGDWHVKHSGFTGLFNTNLIENFCYESGDCDQEMPMQVQKIEKAVKQLSNRERQAVTLKYRFPKRADGVVYTHRELARKLGVSIDAFDKALKRGRSRVKEWVS